MVALSLLQEAEAAGLTVRADGARLVVRGPKSAGVIAERLPNRRPNQTVCLVHDGTHYEVTLGFHPVTGKLREVFTHGARTGSDMDAILDDSSILLRSDRREDRKAGKRSRPSMGNRPGAVGKHLA